MAATVLPMTAPQAPEPPDLLRDPALFERIAEILAVRGFAGDPAPALLAYLGLTSRFLKRPLCLSVVAPSSAGKNAVVDAARALMPPSAYVEFDATTPAAFIYYERDNDDIYKHRTLIFTESDSIPDKGPIASALRTLISKGCVEYATTEETEDGPRRTNKITKAGPSGFISTGVRQLAPQLNTRVLELNVSDDPKLTQEIMDMQARIAAGEMRVASPKDFIAAQCWLGEHGNRDVVIPFAPALSQLMSPRETRMRRDFLQVLTTIEASAFLHQYQRECDASGAVVATTEDYALARRLLAPIFDTVAASVKPSMRRVIEAVKVDDPAITLRELANRLDRAPSTISPYAKQAVEDGYLENPNYRAGEAANFVRTSLSLPDAATSLPTVADLERAVSKGHPSVRRSEGSSNGPRRVA